MIYTDSKHRNTWSFFEKFMKTHELFNTNKWVFPFTNGLLNVVESLFIKENEFHLFTTSYIVDLYAGHVS